jgi:hypothetical protein
LLYRSQVSKGERDNSTGTGSAFASDIVEVGEPPFPSLSQLLHDLKPALLSRPGDSSNFMGLMCIVFLYIMAGCSLIEHSV